MFVKVDYVKEMSVKKSCKHGGYGSFEHLLFLFFFWLTFPALRCPVLSVVVQCWVGVLSCFVR